MSTLTQAPAAAAGRRVRHTGAAIGIDEAFIGWAQRLFGPELLHAADLPAAVKLLQDSTVHLVLLQLGPATTSASAFETLSREIPGIPLVGVSRSAQELGAEELLEMQRSGMSAWLHRDLPDAECAALLSALGGRHESLKREVERHQRAMRLLSQFENWSARSAKRLDEWVHDLRTPLGVIRGYAANLLDGVYGECNQLETVEKIARAAELLRGLIDQVRSDLPAPPAMDDDLKLQRVVGRTQISLEEIGAEVAEFLGSAARAVGAELRLETEPCPLIWGNRMRVIQAMVNLIKNACRFTPDGGRITLRVCPVEPTDEHPWQRCEVSVADTGSGISPELQQKIFEAGFTTGAADGHQGMGLAVVNDVVREHGGSLELSSSPSKGTTFRLLLPVDPRRRRRRTLVHVVRDATFIVSMLDELRRAGADVHDVTEPRRLEELARKIRGGGQELLVLDPAAAPAPRPESEDIDPPSTVSVKES